jgi:hypothetical protein
MKIIMPEPPLLSKIPQNLRIISIFTGYIAARPWYSNPPALWNSIGAKASILTWFSKN